MGYFTLVWAMLALAILPMPLLLLRMFLSVRRIRDALESIAESQERIVQIEVERNKRIVQQRRVA
jgi:heme exporter protein D